MVFGFYFTAVLALVGFPNIASLKIDFTVNVIPFLDMVSDSINACLNVLLFVLKSNTKISEISDMPKSRATYCCSGAYKNIKL